jgi:hypothetical protein
MLACGGQAASARVCGCNAVMFAQNVDPLVGGTSQLNVQRVRGPTQDVFVLPCEISKISVNKKKLYIQTCR